MEINYEIEQQMSHVKEVMSNKKVKCGKGEIILIGYKPNDKNMEKEIIEYFRNLWHDKSHHRLALFHDVFRIFDGVDVMHEPDHIVNLLKIVKKEKSNGRHVIISGVFKNINKVLIKNVDVVFDITK